MSTESAQSKAAGENAAWQAELAKQLSGLTLPELQSLIGERRWIPGTPYMKDKTGERPATEGHWEEGGLLTKMLGTRDAQGRLGPDAEIRQSALSQLESGYGQARFGSKEAINYGALRSGLGRTSPGAVDSSLGVAATALDRDQASAMRNLEFMSAQSSLKDYNQVLQLLGQGSNTALGLAQGFSGAQNAAMGGLSGQSQFGSALGGAASGASLGANFGVYGALVGGVLGAGAGIVSNP